MKGRFIAVQTILCILALVFIATSIFIAVTQQNLIIRILGFAAGPIGAGLAWFSLSAYWQRSTRSSALSVALTLPAVTRPLKIGTIGTQLLLQMAKKNPEAGEFIIKTMDKLAVSHADRIRLERHNQSAMTGTTISQEGNEINEGPFRLEPKGLSIAVDDQAFMIRSGEPSDDYAIIDGTERLLILRTPMPEAVRQSLIARIYNAPFPLIDIADLGPAMQTCVVENVFLAKDEVHLFLESEMLPWREVRSLICPLYPDPDKASLLSRLVKIVWALARGSEPPRKPALHHS